MTKAELLKKLSEKTDLAQTKVDAVLSALVDLVKNETRDNGNEIPLVGLGTFKLKESKERVGFNPLKNQKMHIPATRTVQFRTCSTIKVKL